MRKLYLRWEDFELFHQDINPMEYEYYRSHSGAFQRMWKEQVVRQFCACGYAYFAWCRARWVCFTDSVRKVFHIKL